MQIREGQQQLAVAAQKKEEAEAARFKSLVTMYETMKPRDAAKIFDRLEVNVLLQVASMMNPRSMSEILALMTPSNSPSSSPIARRLRRRTPAPTCRRSRAVRPGSDTRGRRVFRTGFTTWPRIVARDLLDIELLRFRANARKAYD